MSKDPNPLTSIVPGMRFRGELIHDTGSGYGDQWAAPTVDPVDMHSHMTLIHLLDRINILAPCAPELLRKTAKDGLYTTLEQIAAGRCPPHVLKLSNEALALPEVEIRGALLLRLPLRVIQIQ